MRPIRVVLVTSWNTPCGIADHSAQLIAAVQAADPAIEVIPVARALDPEVLFAESSLHLVDIVHLNHHDALHSRWTADHLRRMPFLKTVVTYHDTREALLQGSKLDALQAVADATIVHEPVKGLTDPGGVGQGREVHYWRQGVPAPATHPIDYKLWGVYAQQPTFKAYPQQPILGTAGFHFPWKNYDRLAIETAAAGWALVLCANNATDEDEARWRAMNPHLLVVRGFLPVGEIVNYLAGCDATAFMYECANTGTSGAIRLGIAAHKPLIALRTCRQFRDLVEQDAYQTRMAGYWVEDWDGFRAALQHVSPVLWDPAVRALAHQDSWVGLGQKYAALYRSLVTAAPAAPAAG